MTAIGWGHIDPTSGHFPIQVQRTNLSFKGKATAVAVFSSAPRRFFLPVDHEVRRVKLYPLFADLNGRAVLVVGGGAVAERKIDALLGAGADVTVAAAALTRTLPGLLARR